MLRRLVLAAVCAALVAPVGAARAASVGVPAGAVHLVEAHGYTPDSTAVRWLSGASLNVVVATRTRSADGYAKRAFFFAGTRFVGFDTASDSAGIRVAWRTARTAALVYAIYGRSDPLCCPRGSALVRYRLQGRRLRPLDRVPSLRQRA